MLGYFTYSGLFSPSFLAVCQAGRILWNQEIAAGAPIHWGFGRQLWHASVGCRVFCCGQGSLAQLVNVVPPDETPVHGDGAHHADYSCGDPDWTIPMVIYIHWVSQKEPSRCFFSIRRRVYVQSSVGV